MLEPEAGEYRDYIAFHLPELDTKTPLFFKELLGRFLPDKVWADFKRPAPTSETLEMTDAWMYYAGLAIAHEEDRTDEYLQALRNSRSPDMQIQLLLEVALLEERPELVSEAAAIRRNLPDTKSGTNRYDVLFCDMDICDAAAKFEMTDLFEQTLKNFDEGSKTTVLAKAARYGNPEYVERLISHFLKSDPANTGSALHKQDLENASYTLAINGDYSSAMRLISLHPDVKDADSLLRQITGHAKNHAHLPKLQAAAEEHCHGLHGFYVGCAMVQAGHYQAVSIAANGFIELPDDISHNVSYTIELGSMLRAADSSTLETLREPLTKHFLTSYSKAFKNKDYLAAAQAGISQFITLGSMDILKNLYFDKLEETINHLYEYFEQDEFAYRNELTIVLLSLLQEGHRSEAAYLLLAKPNPGNTAQNAALTARYYYESGRIEAEQLELIKQFADDIAA